MDDDNNHCINDDQVPRCIGRMVIIIINMSSIRAFEVDRRRWLSCTIEDVGGH